MESFHIFLPSNVRDFNGKNTIGNYVTPLPIPIKLDSEWEIGLTEILYTKTRYNVFEPVNLQLMTEDRALTIQVCSFSAGCYRDITNLINEINLCLEKLTNGIKGGEGRNYPPVVALSKQYRQIVVYPGNISKKKTLPTFPPALLGLLGFSEYYRPEFTKEIEIDGKKIKGVMIAELPHDLKANINAFYVYCDIVKASVVGDSYTKLLRTVNIVPSDFGRSVQRIYDQPIYFPVDKKEFQTIEIDIKDDTGKTLQFESGRVQVVLHFRKIK